MTKHTHKAGESLIGMPDKVLLRFDGEYWIGDLANGKIYSEGIDMLRFTEDDDFDWYDLTELGE